MHIARTNNQIFIEIVLFVATLQELTLIQSPVIKKQIGRETLVLALVTDVPSAVSLSLYSTGRSGGQCWQFFGPYGSQPGIKKEHIKEQTTLFSKYTGLKKICPGPCFPLINRTFRMFPCSHALCRLLPDVFYYSFDLWRVINGLCVMLIALFPFSQ